MSKKIPWSKDPRYGRVLAHTIANYGITHNVNSRYVFRKSRHKWPICKAVIEQFKVCFGQTPEYWDNKVSAVGAQFAWVMTPQTQCDAMPDKIIQKYKYEQQIEDYGLKLTE
jgi:hypothetical protein